VTLLHLWHTPASSDVDSA